MRKRKLKLNKQTIRPLTAEQAVRAVGGENNPDCVALPCEICVHTLPHSWGCNPPPTK